MNSVQEWVKFSLRRLVCSRRLLGGVERAKTYRCCVDVDHGVPSSSLTTNTKESAAIVAVGPMGVLLVLLGCRFTQVGNSIVILVAIPVVYLQGGPRAVDPEPREDVGLHPNIIDANPPVAASVVTASNFSGPYAARPINPPRKKTCDRIVVQQVLDPFSVQATIHRHRNLLRVSVGVGAVTQRPTHSFYGGSR